MPPGVVTVTSTVPADPTEEIAVIDVALFTVTPAAAVTPNFTVAPETNPVPEIVTLVPPASGPAEGLTAVTVGTASYVNWSALLVALVPPGVVTVTSTVPAASAGAVAVIAVALLTVTPVAAVVPNFTVAPARNPVPVIVTLVPPANGPADELTAVTVGTASYVNWSALLVKLVTPDCVTVTSTTPADSAGAVAVIEIALFTVTPVAAVLPNLTVAPLTNPVPVIVTLVPPVVGPAVGVVELTAGAP